MKDKDVECAHTLYSRGPYQWCEKCDRMLDYEEYDKWRNRNRIVPTDKEEVVDE